MQQLIITILLLFVTGLGSPVKAQEKDLFPDTPFKILPLPTFDPDHVTNNPPEQEKLFTIDEYRKRPQFEYLMKKKDEKEYSEKLDTLLKDDDFLAKYNIERNEKGFINSDEREKASYFMGQYYFNYWTGLQVGTPTLNLGHNFIDTMHNLFVAQIPLFSIPFKTSYRTVYDAEQSYRYYIRRYPDGRYIIPSLFSLAQCRIHQKDYLEAFFNYKYALNILMEKSGQSDPDLAGSLAHKILYYARKYEEGITINVKIKKIGRQNHIDSRFEFDQNTKSILISIAFGIFFDSTNTHSSNIRF